MAFPSAVLFACNLNRVRSPMAAALLQAGRPDLRVESCGLEPADSVDPFVVAVLDEMGVDVAGHEPRDFGAIERQRFDLVIALTPEAHRHAESLVAAEQAIDVEYWAVSDPTLVEGSRDQRVESYRRTRDELLLRLEGRFGPLPLR